jgi:hypothetical protein
MTIQEIMHQAVTVAYHILNFWGAIVLALSSQCGFISGDTGPIVSENAWWQCSTLVSWLNLRTHPRCSLGVQTWRMDESSSQRHSLAALSPRTF